MRREDINTQQLCTFRPLLQDGFTGAAAVARSGLSGGSFALELS